MNDEQIEAGYKKIAADPKYQAESAMRRNFHRPDAASRSLAGTTIWMVARWLEKHYDGEPFEIFGQKHGYRITTERIPLHSAEDDELERLKNGLIALDDHLLGANLGRFRHELHAFLSSYDIPWNNPA